MFFILYAANLSISAAFSSVLSAWLSKPGALIALSQQISWSHRYAPRPFCLPVGSIITPMFVVRTILVSWRLSNFCRQITHIRCGTCLGLRGFFCSSTFILQNLPKVSTLWEVKFLNIFQIEIFPIPTLTTAFTFTFGNHFAQVFIVH